LIFADFETRSVIDVTKLGATRYAMDPSTQVLCLCWSFDDDADVFLWHRAHQEDGKEPWCQKTRRPDELIERIRSGETFEAHNAGFEFAIWNEVLTREFPEFDVKLKLEQMRCSAAKASCLSLPRALGDALKAVGAPTEFHKMADGRRLINKLSKPRYHLLHMDEEKWLAWARFEISDLYDEGDDFDLETMYSMTGALSKSQRDSIRRMMQRFFLEPGHAETLMPGVYRWTDNPPPPAERDIERPAPAERVAYFDEGEEDHRKNWEYCAQDVRGERWLSKWCPEMTERELEYWRMDQRMNMRGVKLDVAGVEAANELVEQEVKRLNAEMMQITEGAVQGGGKRVAWRNWANKQLTNLNGGYLADTKADTLSFALYGVPIKAGDQAREAAKPAQDEKWGMWGDAALPLKRSMEICLEVNKPSVSKFKRMAQAVCPDGRVHDIMLYMGAERTGRWAGKGIQPHNFVRGYMVEMPEIWGELLSAETDFEFLEAITGGDKALHVLAKACRGALVASDGYELYAADFNAIEARKLAWLSGCVAMLNSFAPGATTDLYCQMASAIYRREITKKDKSERNLGKRAILGLGYCHAADTLILTQRGWVRIDMVRDMDMLWDGHEWVRHRGLICNGEKYVMNLGDTFPTMDHPVWCGEQFHPAEKVVADADLNRRVLEAGVEILPLQDMSSVPAMASDVSWLNATAERRSIKSIWQIIAQVAQLAAKVARNVRRRIRPTNQQCPTPSLEACGLTDSPQQSADATILATHTSNIMAKGVSKSALSGTKIAPLSFGIFRLFRGGMIQILKWIERTMIGIMSRATFAARSGVSNASTRAGQKEKVYDLTNTGPRHRYTILTRDGPMLVHNSMGWEKFQSTVWMDEGIWLPDEFCQDVVKIYRKEMYPEVPALWKASNGAAINAVVEGGEWSCGGDKMGIGSVQYFVEGRFLHCRLPSGRLLAYLDPEVHHRITWTFKAKNERSTPTVVRFPAKPGVAFNRVRYHAEKLAEKQCKTLTNDPPENFSQPHLSFMGRNIVTKKWQRCGAHGGVLVENYDQASSRDLLAEAMHRVDERDPFRLLLSIHDEVIAEAPIGTCKVKEFEDIMAEVPKWASGMPISAEGWIGPRLRK
jgi:hypothetical protein